MRTTLNTVYTMIQSNINRITTDMSRINNQISSGMQMSKISDDPVNLVGALRFRSSITELEQYSENISMGETTISGSETALREMKELTVRAKELAIQAINPAFSSSEHTALAAEIKNLHEQAVMLANTQVNGKYIFGGYRTTGYTDAEPSPFIIDKGNGHWINGTTPTATATIDADTLKINGFFIDASVDDEISTADEDASAAAKATAINAATANTGVTAEIIPATLEGGNVLGGTFDPLAPTGHIFQINNIDILPTGATTTIQPGDIDNVLVTAINAATDTGDPLTSTGVKATRNSSTGAIILTAIDGRNIEIEDTSVLTGLTAGVAPEVTYGSIQLRSDRVFTLEDTDPLNTGTETSFEALGLTGGEATTGEPDDILDDGIINVYSIHDQTGTVRYTGDRENDLEIKIGKVETMVIGENGQSGVAETDIFTSLKQLEDALLNNKFTSVTSTYSATDTSEELDSGLTGMERDLTDPFIDGSFTITVTDHDYYPPTEKDVTIRMDTSVDSLDSVTQRIDGVPNISASWNDDGKLEITSDQPERYTFSLGYDTSNFLSTVGIDDYAMQYNALSQSLTNLDNTLDNITEKISGFGAKANRIDIQSQIYSGLQLAAAENLSKVQDTDLLKAIMELKAKETAYQATLSAAAKTMQLSLVDYL